MVWHRPLRQEMEFTAQPVIRGEFLSYAPQDMLFQKRQHIHDAGKFALVFFPAWARAIARLAAIWVLPTPPLPAGYQNYYCVASKHMKPP